MFAGLSAFAILSCPSGKDMTVTLRLCQASRIRKVEEVFEKLAMVYSSCRSREPGETAETSHVAPKTEATSQCGNLAAIPGLNEK